MGYTRTIRDTGQRVVAWFSCGDASAVAAKLALDKYGSARTVIARIALSGEHADNDRFAAACEAWFGHPVTTLTPRRYAGHRMAKIERQIGRSCIGGGGRPRVFLDELDPKRGRLGREPKIECGITCYKAVAKLGDLA